MTSLEIERVFLLSGMPQLPTDAAAVRIEQGYFGRSNERDGGELQEGRIRRTTRSDASVICHYTIKRGRGLVRNEAEREIDLDEFDRLWLDTVGQRITKTRYVVPADDRMRWEIDKFDAPAGLVVAEIELPDPETPITIPAWLRPHIEREVTEEPHYTNRRLARWLGGLTVDKALEARFPGAR